MICKFPFSLFVIHFKKINSELMTLKNLKADLTIKEAELEALVSSAKYLRKTLDAGIISNIHNLQIIQRKKMYFFFYFLNRSFFIE